MKDNKPEKPEWVTLPEFLAGLRAEQAYVDKYRNDTLRRLAGAFHEEEWKINQKRLMQNE